MLLFRQRICGITRSDAPIVNSPRAVTQIASGAKQSRLVRLRGI
jgi:hypothetical protein